jgi:hypothetical protein
MTRVSPNGSYFKNRAVVASDIIVYISGIPDGMGAWLQLASISAISRQ